MSAPNDFDFGRDEEVTLALLEPLSNAFPEIEVVGRDKVDILDCVAYNVSCCVSLLEDPVSNWISPVDLRRCCVPGRDFPYAPDVDDCQ